MNRRAASRNFLLRGAISLALAYSANSQAGGLWLNEYGDFSGGRASAGSSAGVDDASATLHNPASITRLEGSQLLVTGGMIIPDVEFDVEYSRPILGTDGGGSAGLNAPTGSMFYVHDLDSSDWSAGVYFAGLAGAGLEYNDDWVGRAQATDVTLLVAVLAPTVAYQITDNFSVGGSLQVFYSTLELKLALPNPLPNRDDVKGKLDGSDTNLGFTLGALWELSAQTRIGINYQSALEPEFDGKLQLSVADVSASTDTELTLAQYVRVGLHHEFNEQWAIELTWGWDDWSALDNVFVVGSDNEAALKKNWSDTYHYAAGFQYQLSDKWAITSGVAYDTNPVDATDRTADLPVDRQIRVNFGVRYAMSDTLNVGGYVGYADLGSAKIRTDNWGGEYSDNAAYSFSVNGEWQF